MRACACVWACVTVYKCMCLYVCVHGCVCLCMHVCIRARKVHAYVPCVRTWVGGEWWVYVYLCVFERVCVHHTHVRWAPLELKKNIIGDHPLLTFFLANQYIRLYLFQFICSRLTDINAYARAFHLGRSRLSSAKFTMLVLSSYPDSNFHLCVNLSTQIIHDLYLPGTRSLVSDQRQGVPSFISLCFHVGIQWFVINCSFLIREVDLLILQTKW